MSLTQVPTSMIKQDAGLKRGHMGAESALPTGLGPFPFLGSTAPDGWVFAFGTIGSASSGASNRANADCEQLFKLIWASESDSEAPVSGGRGASADADWSANKTIDIPDMRDRMAIGKGDMGGTHANRLGATLSGTTTNDSAVITGLSSTAGLAIGMAAIGANIPAGRTIASIDSSTQVTLNSGASVTAGTASIRFTVLDSGTRGASGGSATHTLTTQQMPAHSHNWDAGGNPYYMLRSSGSGIFGWTSGALPQTSNTTGVQNTGGGQAHPVLPPARVTNMIIKL